MALEQVFLNTDKVYNSKKSEYSAIDNLSGVDMIKFSNGSVIIVENDGIVVLDKEKYSKKLI